MNHCTRRYFFSLATYAGAAGMSALILPSCGPARNQHRTYADSLASICNQVITDTPDTIIKAANECANTILTRGTCFIAPCTLHGGTVPDIPYLPAIFTIIRSAGMAGATDVTDIIVSAGLPEEVVRAHNRGVPVIAIKTPEDGNSSPEAGATAVITGDMPTDGTVSSPFPLTDTLIGAITGEAYVRSGGIGLTNSATPAIAYRYIELVQERTLSLDSRSDAVQAAATIMADTLRNGGTAHIVDTCGLFHRDLASSIVLPPGIAALPVEAIPAARITPNDCIMYLSMTSGSRRDLSMVGRLTSAGAPLIAICPHDEGGGFRVYKKAAVSIDNSSPEKEGIISFDGGRNHFLHTGHIVNAAAAWNIIGETIRSLSETGRSA